MNVKDRKAAEAKVKASTARVKKAQPAESAGVAKQAAETDAELAARLLATPTIADKSWAPARGAARNAGESRSQFIRRVLLGEAS